MRGGIERTGGAGCAVIRNLIVVLAAATLLTSLAGCTQEGSIDGSKSFVPSGAKVTQTVSGSYADYSFGDFCIESDAVFVGEYSGKSDPFLVEPVDGSSPLYFTDYYFSVTQVGKGSLPASALESPAQTVAVRQRGGEGDMVALVDESALQPVEGQSYLLFLYRIENGAEHNTEGDHFYLMSGYRGAWALNSSGSYEKPDGSESVSARTLATRISAALPQGDVPSGEEEDYRAAYLAEIEERFRNGEIPESYYDEVMEKAVKEDSQFARVMTEDEAMAYEEEIMSSYSG